MHLNASKVGPDNPAKPNKIVSAGRELPGGDARAPTRRHTAQWVAVNQECRQAAPQNAGHGTRE